MSLQDYLDQGFEKIEPSPIHMNGENASFDFYRKISIVSNRSFVLSVDGNKFYLHCFMDYGTAGNREQVLSGVFQ